MFIENINLFQRVLDKLLHNRSSESLNIAYPLTLGNCLSWGHTRKTMNFGADMSKVLGLTVTLTNASPTQTPWISDIPSSHSFLRSLFYSSLSLDPMRKTENISSIRWTSGRIFWKSQFFPFPPVL